MIRFGALLDRLSFTPGRLEKLRLLAGYFASTPDPDRGYALAALTGRLALRQGDPDVHMACCGPNTWTAAAGSGTVFINGQPAHRQGDQVTHCGGTGHIRSTESTALHVLRAIEEEGVRRRSAEVTVSVPEPVGLYILNQKRATLQQVEARCGMHVFIKTDATLIPPQYKLERMRALTPAEVAEVRERLTVAGAPTEEAPDGLRTRDPWNNALVVRS